MVDIQLFVIQLAYYNVVSSLKIVPDLVLYIVRQVANIQQFQIQTSLLKAVTELARW